MMKVIVPNTIDLNSCSVTENDTDDGPLWNASTTYAKDAKVRYNHVRYSSLDDGNTGNDPSKTWSGDNAKWKKIEATGPYFMLDEYVETQTKAPLGQDLSFCVPFDRADAFALLNTKGFQVTATITDEEILYEETINLMQDIFHMSLFEYNYSPLYSVSRFVRTSLPLAIDGELCITLEPGDDTEVQAAVGHVIVGRQRELGWTEYDAELGFTDYSKKTTNEFGVTQLVRRSYANTTSLPLYLHPDQMDFVADTLASVRGIPCLWIGDNDDDGKQCLSVYGWLEDFRLVYAGPNEARLSLEIQGLI